MRGPDASYYEPPSEPVVIKSQSVGNITVELVQLDDGYWASNVYEVVEDDDIVYLNNTGSVEEDEARQAYVWDLDCFLQKEDK